MTETDLLSGLQQVPEIARTYEFVQEFQTMVWTRTPASREREYSDPNCYVNLTIDDRGVSSIV